jgi:lipid-binding SYLF domain-containing protein
MNASMTCRWSRVVAATVVAATLLLASHAASAATAKELNRAADAALKHLYATTPAAKTLGAKAKAILIFPRIVKAGFMVGGQIGDGVLRKSGKTVGYYRSLAGSYGFQAGVQWFGYVLFLMTDSASSYIDATNGWELGTGPSLVIVDTGMAKSLTTTTLRDDVYAFIFAQRGLMGGIGIQGSKISRIAPP